MKIRYKYYLQSNTVAVFPPGNEREREGRSIPHILNNNLNKITNTAKYNYDSMIKGLVFVSIQISLLTEGIQQYDWQYLGLDLGLCPIL